MLVEVGARAARTVYPLQQLLRLTQSLQLSGGSRTMTWMLLLLPLPLLLLLLLEVLLVELLLRLQGLPCLRFAK